MNKHFLENQNSDFRNLVKRVGQKLDYRSILDQISPGHLEQVATHANEARNRKNCEKLFLALEKNDITAAYCEHETVERHTRSLAEDDFITNEQADEICFLIECTLLDWLKKVDDCSNPFLDDVKIAITRTASESDFDSAWTFDEIEFYLQLGVVPQESLNQALQMVMEAENVAQQANQNDIAKEFNILTQVFTSWGATEPPSSMPN